VVLLGVACGDDDAATTEAPTTTVQATTIVSTTVVEETTTTISPAQVAVMMAQALVGDYTGEWSNTMYGSSGSIEAEVFVDAATATATVNVDLGGFVLGIGDPPAETFTFEIGGEPPLTGTSEVVGDFTLDVAMDGTFGLTADAIPDPSGRVTALTMTGSIGMDGSIEGDYMVNFSDGTTAEGTVSVAKS